MEHNSNLLKLKRREFLGPVTGSISGAAHFGALVLSQFLGPVISMDGQITNLQSSLLTFCLTTPVQRQGFSGQQWQRSSRGSLNGSFLVMCPFLNQWLWSRGWWFPEGPLGGSGRNQPPFCATENASPVGKGSSVAKRKGGKDARGQSTGSSCHTLILQLVSCPRQALSRPPSMLLLYLLN